MIHGIETLIIFFILLTMVLLVIRRCNLMENRLGVDEVVLRVILIEEQIFDGFDPFHGTTYCLQSVLLFRRLFLLHTSCKSSWLLEFRRLFILFCL